MMMIKKRTTQGRSQQPLPAGPVPRLSMLKIRIAKRALLSRTSPAGTNNYHSPLSKASLTAIV